MIPNYKKIRSENSDIRQIQDAIALVIDQISSKDILDGILVEDISLVSGVNLVSHKLDRAPKGFIVVARNANQNVWNGVSTRAVSNLNMALQCSGSVKVSIWFF